MPRDDYNPLPFKPLPVPAKDPAAVVKAGEINPVPQPSQGFSGWLRSAKEFLAAINWIHAAILIPTPLIAIYGLLYITPSKYTIIFTLFYYFLTGIGITAGYHRLWAHKVCDDEMGLAGEGRVFVNVIVCVREDSEACWR